MHIGVLSSYGDVFWLIDVHCWTPNRLDSTIDGTHLQLTEELDSGMDLKTQDMSNCRRCWEGSHRDANFVDAKRGIFVRDDCRLAFARVAVASGVDAGDSGGGVKGMRKGTAQ